MVASFLYFLKYTTRHYFVKWYFIGGKDILRIQTLPPLILEGETEKRRNSEALARREMRLAEKAREKAGG